MTTVGREASIIASLVAIGLIVLAIMLVRGPVREAAWGETCEALYRGEAIQGHWNTIEPCRAVRPRQ